MVFSKRVLFGIFLTFSLNQVVLGQDMSNYNFSLQAFYTPSCVQETEWYSKEGKIYKHVFRKNSFERCENFQQEMLRPTTRVEKLIQHIFLLKNSQAFTLQVPAAVVKRLKTPLPTSNPQQMGNPLKKRYNITNADIDRFIGKNNVVTLFLKDIATDETEVTITDGAPFVLKITTSNDSIMYNGNFLDQVPSSSIKYWLPWYLAFRQYPFSFDKIELVKKYFSDEQLEGVLARFIAWSKNK